MNTLTHRRNICEIQSEKENYQRHMDRLQKLKLGHSPQQLRRDVDEKKLLSTINKVRKMHTYNRAFRIKQMKSLQKASKQKDYTKVKSVVKQSIKKQALPVAPKHRRNLQPIINQNEKILQRILQAKSKLNLSTMDNTQRTPKGFSSTGEADFSRIYEKSMMVQNKKKILKINLCKHGSKWNKIIIEFELDNLIEVFREISEFYSLEFTVGAKTERTGNVVLGEIGTKKIVLKINQNSFNKHGMIVKFYRVLDNKEIFRGMITIDGRELSSEDQPYLKLNQNCQRYFQKPLCSNNGKHQHKSTLLFSIKKIEKGKEKIQKYSKTEQIVRNEL